MPVIYKEKVEYAYTDPGVKAHTLSWAEYQALSEAEKMNGDLYFIPDKQPEGNPSRIWAKLGTEPLDTQAEDVSGAVNELSASLSEKSNSFWNNLGGITVNGNGNYTFATDEYSEYILIIGIPVSGSVVACKTCHIPALLFLNQGYQFDYYNSATYRYAFQVKFTSRTTLNISDWSMGSAYTQMSVRLFGRNRLN